MMLLHNSSLTFVAAVDPNILTQSPELPGVSLGSPYGSPHWNSNPSPLATPALQSPRLEHHQNHSARLSPSYRAHPYPQVRRSSTSSISSWKSARGSPSMQEFQEYCANDMVSRPVRPGSSNGSHNGKEGKETLCVECNKCFRDLR